MGLDAFELVLIRRGWGLEERLETKTEVSFLLSGSEMAQLAAWLYFAVRRSTCV